MQKAEYSQDEIDNLPIDITSNKLLEWLIDRRHVDLKWQTAALVVREKINNAIQDMPAVDEITQLLSGTYINYFHCRRILELLKETEAGSKNIFGYYSSTRMKDWQEIIHLYEKDNLYLAEAADMLIRNVSYEIPALKKQISKCKQTQTECERKERDYVVNAAEMKEQFNTSCKQFGIKGQKVRSELLGLVKDLSTFYDDIVKKTQNLQNTFDFYEAFVQFSCGGDEVVPMVRYVQDKGNTTVYQWKTGKVPTSVEEPKQETGDEDDEITEDQIDLGGFIEEVDYGITLEDSGNNPTDGENIDWGDVGDDINFDIDVVADVTVETGKDDGVARGTDTLSLLDHALTRSNFIDELLELQGFLNQRYNEMKGEADILSVNQFQTAPSILQLQNVDSVASMLAELNEIIDCLTSVKMKHLFLIRSSPKYVDRLTESLKEKLEQAEKMLASQNAVAEKRKASLAEQKQIEPKVGILVTKTKELQKQIEDDISKRYKNRPVNLMGAINLI
ncbi:CDK5 regulatory subunit-associated protein 3-like [Ptychodera flava]|uniref:CDK5 regulatory subunit-associated protein 3-like n=1 Tax=Ptychodera flava TaxID=63121 RepID=UPI003969DBC8